MRKMAWALFKVQRNTRQVRLVLDANKPIRNHGIDFALENVRHSFHRARIPALPWAGHKLCRFAHYILRSSVFRFTDLVDCCRLLSRLQYPVNYHVALLTDLYFAITACKTAQNESLPCLLVFPDALRCIGPFSQVPDPFRAQVVLSSSKEPQCSILVSATGGTTGLGLVTNLGRSSRHGVRELEGRDSSKPIQVS